MIRRRGHSKNMTCDGRGCERNLVFPHYIGDDAARKDVGDVFHWSHVKDKDYCPSCTAARAKGGETG